MNTRPLFAMANASRRNSAESLFSDGRIIEQRAATTLVRVEVPAGIHDEHLTIELALYKCPRSPGFRS